MIVNGKKETTITFDGLSAVKYDTAYPYFSIRNDGESTIYVSLQNDTCTPDADNVVSYPPAGIGVVGGEIEGYRTLYLNGEGTVSIIGQYDAICRFKSLSKGGDGGTGGTATVTFSRKTFANTGGSGIYINSDGVCIDTYEYGTDVEIYYRGSLERADKIYVYNANPDLYGIFQTYSGVSYDNPNPYLIGTPFSHSGVYDVPEDTTAIVFCRKNDDNISGLYNSISDVATSGDVTCTYRSCNIYIQAGIGKSFPSCSLSDIIHMVELDYQGLIDIEEYWGTGEINENFSVSAIPAQGDIWDAHAAQDIPLKIIDLRHDTLFVPINGKSRAAITLGSSRLLNGACNFWGYQKALTNEDVWGNNCPRRGWYNTDLKNAFPAIVRDNVKAVIKTTKTTHAGSELGETIDYVFPLSVYEIYGRNDENWSVTTHRAEEGEQYRYYKIPTNRTAPNVYTDGREVYRWTRSPCSTPDGQGVVVYDDRCNVASNNKTGLNVGWFGLDFAFCL